MNQALQEIQARAGATFAPSSPSETEAIARPLPLNFGNDAEALQAARTGVALYDRSHWGLLELTGGDRLRFVHNQSTNDFNRRSPGDGCDTVFVTNTARTIDFATGYVTEDAVLLLVSPRCRTQIFNLLDRYIFPADNVELRDRSDDLACFTLLGDDSRTLLKQLIGDDTAADLLPGKHQLVTLPDLGDLSVRLAHGSGLALPGYTLLCEGDRAPDLWQALHKGGATPLGEAVWDRLRIEQGRPAPGYELTDDYNPLEAGLWHCISFDKGCYIGQETIARLNTYQGVKQQLWGLQLQGYAEPGTAIAIDDSKVGKLTSITEVEGGYLGLGYIRTKAGGAGLTVRVGDPSQNLTAKVMDVPFLSRGYLAQTS